MDARFKSYLLKKASKRSPASLYQSSSVVAQHWQGGTTSFGAPWKTVTVLYFTIRHCYSKLVHSRLCFETEYLCFFYKSAGMVVKQVKMSLSFFTSGASKKIFETMLFTSLVNTSCEEFAMLL